MRETTGRVGGEWAVVNRESRGAGSRALFRSCVLTASWLLPCCSSSRLTCNQSRSSEGLGGASMSEAGTVNLIAGARGNKHGSCGGRLLRGKAHGQMRAACQHGAAWRAVQQPLRCVTSAGTVGPRRRCAIPTRQAGDSSIALISAEAALSMRQAPRAAGRAGHRIARAAGARCRSAHKQASPASRPSAGKSPDEHR